MLLDKVLSTRWTTRVSFPVKSAGLWPNLHHMQPWSWLREASWLLVKGSCSTGRYALFAVRAGRFTFLCDAVATSGETQQWLVPVNWLSRWSRALYRQVFLCLVYLWFEEVATFGGSQYECAGEFPIETLLICRLSSRKFTTHNDFY